MTVRLSGWKRSLIHPQGNASMRHGIAESRRRFLRYITAGVSGLALPALLRAGDQSALPPRAKACILLYMDGGPSHIDLWDMKPSAPAEIRGPWNSIGTSVPGLRISELLPGMASQMHRVTLLRSVRHQEMVHDPAVYQMLTGYKHFSSAGDLKVEPTDAPQMGAAFARADRQRAVMPKAIHLPETMKMGGRVLPGQSAGRMGPTHDPFRVELSSEAKVIKPELGLQNGLSGSRLAGWSPLLKSVNDEFCRLQPTADLEHFDAYQQQALDILSAPSVERAYDLGLEPAQVRDRYGRHRHGQSVLLARRLVEGGARFVTVYWGKQLQDWADGKAKQLANNPWDTHRNHFPLVKDTLAPPADQAFSALLEDLDQRGLLDGTLVVWMGDFGRTPRINRQFASRDHWPHAFSIIMAGGGMPRGAIYGATDRHAAEVTQSPVSPADLTATVFQTLGINPTTTIRGDDGQSHPMSAGQPIADLLA